MWYSILGISYIRGGGGFILIRGERTSLYGAFAGGSVLVAGDNAGSTKHSHPQEHRSPQFLQ